MTKQSPINTSDIPEADEAFFKSATLRRPGEKYFADDREPLAQRGRRSIPKSHRAEGENFVD